MPGFGSAAHSSRKSRACSVALCSHGTTGTGRKKVNVAFTSVLNIAELFPDTRTRFASRATVPATLATLLPATATWRARRRNSSPRTRTRRRCSRSRPSSAKGQHRPLRCRRCCCCYSCRCRCCGAGVFAMAHGAGVCRSYGTVYRALDKRDGQLVAIKVRRTHRRAPSAGARSHVHACVDVVHAPPCRCWTWRATLRT